MELLRKPEPHPARLAVFSAAWNPPTRAHLAIANAALDVVDQVLFVLPRRFPHKQYDHVTLHDRAELVLAATADEPRIGVAISEGGLFIDIARECREIYGDDVELWFLCGRDAAERIVNWDYGEPGVITKHLEEYGLLVADRAGRYEVPTVLEPRCRRLEVAESLDEISATEVRRRIAAGESWKDLVPTSIAGRIQELYR